jgi:hypothetical protein
LSPASYYFLVSLTLWQWRWRQHVPPRLLWSSARPHETASQKIVIFTATAVRTLSSTYKITILSLSKTFMSVEIKKTVIKWGPCLWSSGQNSWLQIQRSVFDSRHYKIFWEIVGLEQGLLSLVSTIEELLERKSSGSSL